MWRRRELTKGNSFVWLTQRYRYPVEGSGNFSAHTRKIAYVFVAVNCRLIIGVSWKIPCAEYEYRERPPYKNKECQSSCDLLITLCHLYRSNVDACCCRWKKSYGNRICARLVWHRPIIICGCLWGCCNLDLDHVEWYVVSRAYDLNRDVRIQSWTRWIKDGNGESHRLPSWHRSRCIKQNRCAWLYRSSHRQGSWRALRWR